MLLVPSVLDVLELTSHGANKKGDFVGKLVDIKARKVNGK